MKKYLKILVFVAMFLLPIKVHASSISVSLSCPSVASAGQKINCTISTSNSGDISSIMINYSFTGGATYSNFQVGGSFGLVNPKSVGVQIGQPGGTLPKSGKLGTLVVQIPSSATSGSQYTIGLVGIEASTSDYQDIYGSNVTKTVTVKSSNNYLRALAVSGGSISFQKTKTSYNVNVPNTQTTTNITAATEDARASLTGTGTRTLKVGKNTFNVVVTAESGAKRTYTIVVNRAAAEQPQQPQQPTPQPEPTPEPVPETPGLPGDGTHQIEAPNTDKKDSNNKLSKLSIEGLSLPFDPANVEYELFVGFETGEINIIAESESTKAKITGAGSNKLTVGRNVIRVTVTAENGKTRVYEIVINRDKEESKNANNKLKNLEIVGKKIDFDPDVNEYTIINSANSLDLIVTLASEDSTYSIKGNSNLVDGSVVRIKVSDADGNINVYKININMPPNAKKAGEGNSLLMTILIIVSLIIGFGGMGFGTFMFMKNKKKDEEPLPELPPVENNIEEFAMNDTREDATMPDILSMTADITPVAESIYEQQTSVNNQDTENNGQ